MIRKLFTIAFLIQLGNEVRCVFCMDIQGNFSEIQIGANTAGGYCADSIANIIDDGFASSRAVIL